MSLTPEERCRAAASKTGHRILTRGREIGELDEELKVLRRQEKEVAEIQKLTEDISRIDSKYPGRN